MRTAKRPPAPAPIASEPDIPPIVLDALPLASGTFNQIETHDVAGSDGIAGVNDFDWAAQGGSSTSGGAQKGTSAGDQSAFAGGMQGASGAIAAFMNAHSIATLTPSKLYQLAFNPPAGTPSTVSHAAKFMLANPDAYNRLETHDVAGSDGIAGVNDFILESLRYYPSLGAEHVRMVLVHSGPRILPERAVFTVVRNADDLHGRGFFIPHLDAAADGILPGPVLPHEALVHDGDQGRARHVAVRERPSAAQRNVERLEVTGPDGGEGHLHVFLRAAGVAFDDEAPVASAQAQRRILHERRGHDAGQRAHRLQRAHVERPPRIRVVFH